MVRVVHSGCSTALFIHTCSEPQRGVLGTFCCTEQSSETASPGIDAWQQRSYQVFARVCEHGLEAAVAMRDLALFVQLYVVGCG